MYAGFDLLRVCYPRFASLHRFDSRAQSRKGSGRFHKLVVLTKGFSIRRFSSFALANLCDLSTPEGQKFSVGSVIRRRFVFWFCGA